LSADTAPDETSRNVNRFGVRPDDDRIIIIIINRTAVGHFYYESGPSVRRFYVPGQIPSGWSPDRTPGR